MCDLKHVLFTLALAMLGCGDLRGQADGLSFMRCAQSKPAARTYRAGVVTLTVQDRVLQVQGATQLAAFTGPVGRSFTSADVNLLNDGELAIWLGGLGDTIELAQENLAKIASRRVPTVFIAGGADRWPIIEKAFEALPEDIPIVQGSGLRVLRLGDQHFAIAAGAPRGRYAIDEQGCGLTPEEISAIQTEAGRADTLLSWHASRASSELSTLARAVGATTNLSAFPEPAGPDDAFTVPRLGQPGTQRADGARLTSRVAHYVLGPDGLRPRP